MTHERAAKLLNDHIDGTLSSGAERDLRSHLALCPACRAELERLADLVAAAGHLPASIEPERDLWEGIETAIGAPAAAVARRIPPRRVRAAAAGLAAVAALILFMLGLNQGLFARRIAEKPADRAEVAERHIALLEAEGRRGEAILNDAIERAADPIVLARLRDELKIIDAAIDRAQAAWRNDPRNARLARRVASGYRARSELLGKVARIASPE